MRIVVIGGGAAGFFGAIRAKSLQPDADVILLEKAKAFLSKVRVSGGGRCNVTHACFDPKILVKNYPRGSKELLGPFYQFSPKDTIAWFEDRNVKLKIESDGRMFPTTDSSETIINCLMQEAKKVGVSIRGESEVLEIKKVKEFSIVLKNDVTIHADALLIATGSNSKVYAWLESLGHKIVDPVPSLFTFMIKDERIDGIPGLSVPAAHVKIKECALQETGPLLITHWGLSGPGILKLSAWGARVLHDLNYKATLIVNWPGLTEKEVKEAFIYEREAKNNRIVSQDPLFEIPKNLWKRLVPSEKSYIALSNKEIQSLTDGLVKGEFKIDGKSLYKDEFVTAGGVALEEVDFKTMQSKIVPGLYFAGEVLNIDAITGGFNFQNAWTTSWIAASSISILK